MNNEQVRLFDPTADWSVVERQLPHWTQAGTLCFVTIRMWDSIPKEVLQRMLRERAEWLARHGISSSNPQWRSQLDQLDEQHQREFRHLVWRRWDSDLDECHGSCVLKNPRLASIVADSLRYFHGDRYELTDYVIMPNHFHLIAAFRDESGMLSQCESWKHFTATKINRLLGRDGRFWQQDGFDHLIRIPESFGYFRRYIADNPSAAHLSPNQYLHESFLECCSRHAPP